LLGFPFLAGFYSKDSILERFYNKRNATLSLAVFLLGVGLTTAYSAKIVRLALRTPGGVAPARLNSGGTSTSVKLPLLRLGSGAVVGGALMGRGFTAATPVLAPADKLLPLTLVAGGALVGWALSRLKAGFLRRIWDLTPTYQALAQGSVRMRALRVVDEGAGEALRGPGWLVLLLG